MTDHTLWADQVQGLGDIRRCIAPDLRGFGRSAPVVPGVLDRDRYVDDLAEILWSLDAGPADVVGFSAGGSLAIALYERHPGLVRSLVLNTPGVGPVASPPPPGGVAKPGERGSPDYLDRNAERAVYEGKVALFDRFQVAHYHFGPRAPLSAKARYRAAFEGTRTDMMVSTFMTLPAWGSLMHVLPTIGVPVLYLRGVDESLPLEITEGLLAQVADTELVHIPDSGRFVMIENPAATNAAIRRFWSRQS